MRKAIGEDMPDVGYEFRERRGNRYIDDLAGFRDAIGFKGRFGDFLKADIGKAEKAWLEEHQEEFPSMAAAKREFAKITDPHVKRAKSSQVITPKKEQS